MIINEQQYKVTLAAAARFRKAISDITAEAATRKNVHPRLLRAEREGMKCQLADLEAELREYEVMKLADYSSANGDSSDEQVDFHTIYGVWAGRHSHSPRRWQVDSAV